MSVGLANTEMLQIADAVGREKNIPKEVILEAMEGSLAIAARKKYGHDNNVKAEIDRKTGEVRIFRAIEVVGDDYVPEEEDAPETLTLDEAKKRDENIEIGGFIYEPLPSIDLGRVAAQTAKQVIIHKVREAERDRQFNDYQPRIGEVVNGVVKRVEFGHVIVDLGNAEAIIQRDQVIRGEAFKVNDRIRAYLLDVRRENKGPQIFLSRTAPEFMAKLFMQEVPEIYDNIIEIKGVAREPGSRAKIAVFSTDPNIDPVGSCVGIRGSRVQAVINELQGERIDIIQWSSDSANFLISALSPAEVSKVVIDEDRNRIEVVVPDDQLSLAIGRRGQNVRLASELVGWNIDVMTEEEESKRRTEEFERLSTLFVSALNVEEMIAHLLITEGFSSVEELAFIELAELASVEGFDEAVAQELQDRAKEYLEQRKADVAKIYKKLGVKKDLAEFSELDEETIIALAEKDIKSLDDFADLARDEFMELLPESGLSEKEIDALIMKAREHWFEDEDNAESEPEATNDE